MSSFSNQPAEYNIAITINLLPTLVFEKQWHLSIEVGTQ